MLEMMCDKSEGALWSNIRTEHCKIVQSELTSNLEMQHVLNINGLTTVLNHCCVQAHNSGKR